MKVNQPTPKISEAEWEVMKIVWRTGGATAQQVHEALPPGKSWREATVKTLLNRLFRKRILKAERNADLGRAYLYRPLLTEAECRASEADSFLTRIFDGSLSPLLAHFVASKKLSDREIAELEAILNNQSGQGNRKNK